MTFDLSHIKVPVPQSQPYRGLGSPLATGSDPKELADAFKLGLPVLASDIAQMTQDKMAEGLTPQEGAQDSEGPEQLPDVE